MTPEDKAFFEGMYGNTGGGAGTGGSGSGGGGGCDAPAMVFRVAGGCGTTNCHDGTTRQSGLDLSTANPFDALVSKATDQTGTGSACQSNTGLIVDPANAAASLLYTKIATSVPCGSPMPFPIGPMDNGAGAMCVLSWIQANLQ